MHFNLKLTVLALCCTVALADLTTRQQVEMNVMNLLMQTRAQSRDNPSRSIGCVDYYIPKLQAATNEYDRSLRQCETDRKNAIEGVESSRQDELQTISASTEDSCSKLRACSEETSSSKAFECYSSSGADGQKALYGISKDSSALLKELEEEKQAIEGEKVKCTNTCDRTYTEESQRLNAAMTDCILGLEEVPTEPSTETPTDPTTTTDAPTDAPPTTEATNEPTTTTEVVTDDPTTEAKTDEPTPTTEVVTEGPTTGATTEVITDEPTSGAPSEPTAEPPTETESGESGSSGEPESNESKSPEEDLRRRARVMFASYIPRS